MNIGLGATLPTGAVIDTWVGEEPVPEDIASTRCFLEIPSDKPFLYLGYHYLGDLVFGITVLGSDFETSLEAPPAPGCYWGGSEWVCPVAE